MENQLVLVKTELQELLLEHDNLKDDFRTLVRKYDGEKERNKSPHQNNESPNVLSKTKLLHEAQKGQMLMETEEKLEAAILQLQLREAEMDSVAQHFDNVNQQIHDRDMELHNLRGQVAQLQQNLSESFNENHTLKETVNQQKVNHLINALDSYDINQVIKCFCIPRLP